MKKNLIKESNRLQTLAGVIKENDEKVPVSPSTDEKREDIMNQIEELQSLLQGIIGHYEANYHLDPDLASIEIQNIRGEINKLNHKLNRV